MQTESLHALEDVVSALRPAEGFRGLIAVRRVGEERGIGGELELGHAFTLVLEIDGIRRFPSARDFVSYCRLVPGAGNSGGTTRHKRTKDGNRYLKRAFTHAAVRAIEYDPEIQRFYRALARRKPPVVARAVVAKELARMVYFMLTKQEDFNGTFKGKALSRTKQLQWPRLASPPASLEQSSVSAARRVPPPCLIGPPGVVPPRTSGTGREAANRKWCMAAIAAPARRQEPARPPRSRFAQYSLPLHRTIAS